MIVTYGRLMGMAFLVGVVVIFASAAYRAGQSDLVRPLNEDELITLRYYTWAGVQARRGAARVAAPRGH